METSHIEDGSWLGATIADEITINLGTVQASGIATSDDDGQRNTRDVYNFEGIQLVNEIINRIQNITGFAVSTEGSGTFPTDNASIACMKLNSWNIVEAQDDYILKLSSETDNPDWYLPARNEMSGITDAEYPLEGEYWTSTAVTNNNQEAYKYIAGGTTSLEQRDAVLHVRAVRKKP